MTYKQLLSMLSELPDSYLDQDVCYQAFEEKFYVNALRLSLFSYDYLVDDPSIPEQGALLLSHD
jgi:hypothetical protein